MAGRGNVEARRVSSPIIARKGFDDDADSTDGTDNATDGT